MKHRKERLSSLIREELSGIFVKELEFSALVTITEVELSEDLNKAVVNISVLPSEKAGGVLKILNQNVSKLRYLLLKKLKLRTAPILNFKIDSGPQKSAEVEKLLLGDKMEE